ncbi:MAG: peptidoglycan-associated lipoprotein Pal [Gammaproteobacteria bacterium]|nr:peptidoglycan-associated lipoprotein Pal [Gammaproteobacteria bacterium]MCP5138794.1 peptidoglycan-associated lipoprotein Pal [Chromatiales bacterium]
MTMMKSIAALLTVMLLAACAGPSKSTVDENAAGSTGTQAGGAMSSGVNEGGMGQGAAMGGSALGGPGASQENRIIYFDYDRFDVKSEYNPVLQAHGKYLSANPTSRVRLEGHADERGSREYNIGLGEKRAQAVRNVLLLQGAASDQINTVSFGEERPAVTGDDEEAWSLNRRVEIVYGQ